MPLAQCCGALPSVSLHSLAGSRSSCEFRSSGVQANGWKAWHPRPLRSEPGSTVCEPVRGPVARPSMLGPVGVGCSSVREGWRATRSTLESQAGRVRPTCAWCWGGRARVGGMAGGASERRSLCSAQSSRVQAPGPAWPLPGAETGVRAQAGLPRPAHPSTGKSAGTWVALPQPLSWPTDRAALILPREWPAHRFVRRAPVTLRKAWCCNPILPWAPWSHKAAWPCHSQGRQKASGRARLGSAEPVSTHRVRGPSPSTQWGAGRACAGALASSPTRAGDCDALTTPLAVPQG